MSGVRRLLILGGIALALVGMSYGLWYAVFNEHQELEGLGKSLTAGFSAAAERNAPAAAAALKQYKEQKYAYDRHVDVHSHWIGLAMLLIVLGIAFECLAFFGGMKVLLALGLVLCSFPLPVGVFLQTSNHGAVPRAVAIAGS